MTKIVEVGECWEWQGYSANSTPQVMHYPGGVARMYSVRRLLRELIAGKAQPDGHYTQNCGNPLCVCPDHTLWRSKAVHMKMMGRKRGCTPLTINKLRQSRIDNGFTKLDMSKAQTIRLSDESSPVLAKRYGVDRSLINRIKAGRAWRVITGPFAGLFK